MKLISGFAAGVLFTLAAVFTLAPQPKFTETASGWKLEHIPMPPCTDGYKRTADMPERDEVDAMTITCARQLPDRSLALDANGRTE